MHSDKQLAPEQKTSARHSLEAAKKVRKVVKDSYIRARQAVMEGKPVAWYMVCYINPIFMAMDIVPIMPENWAALCAAKRAAEPYILRAESEGYSNNVCSYSRIGMGYCSMVQAGDVPPDVPDGGLAKPAMLIGSSAYCDIRYKYFQSIARYLDAPCYCFDNQLFPPFTTIGQEEVKKRYVRYQVEQYRGLVEFMERVTGRRMDWDRLSSYVDIAIETWRLRFAIDQMKSAVPCPVPQEDENTLQVPALLMEGEPSSLELFKELYAEVKHRVDNGIGVIPDEKYRLMWVGMSPLHTMKIFNYFEDLGAVVVSSAWLAPYIDDALGSVSDPLERLALRDYLWALYRFRRTRGLYNRGHEGPVRELIEARRVDGVVFHVARSCRYHSIGLLYGQKVVQEETDVPTLMLESDLCDVRDFSEAEWNLRIKAFIETVDAHKRAKVA